MEDKLLIECGSVDNCYVEMNLNESTTNKKGVIYFKGKFQEAEAINKNNRKYTKDILDENVQKLQDAISKRGLVGELDHASDSIIHFEKASHVITKLWWEGNNLMGQGEIINSPSGAILKSLIEAGIRVGISSRGVGSGKVNEEGVLVIGENYKLITFDCVADPSTNGAYQSKITENKIFEKIVKNESRSIHKHIDKNVLVACLGNMINKEIGTIKARL